MRRFVIVGQQASSSPGFSLLDLPSTSGRLDVLLRCLRAALLVSHGMRRDTVVYLVLLGDPAAPRTIRVEGAHIRFLRPDERSLAMLVQRAMAVPPGGAGFAELRTGIAVADGGLEVVLGEVAGAVPYVLEEDAPDVRDCPLDIAECVFFLGDHLGFDTATRARLAALGATPVGVGPVSLHADDAITIVANELDRRAARSGAGPG
jgi:tRNA (pseudouridine54-N1)-methyltransferase